MGITLKSYKFLLTLSVYSSIGLRVHEIPQVLLAKVIDKQKKKRGGGGIARICPNYTRIFPEFLHRQNGGGGGHSARAPPPPPPQSHTFLDALLIIQGNEIKVPCPI